MSESSLTPRFLITGLNGVTGWNLFQGIAAEEACRGTYRKPHRVFNHEKFLRLDFNDPAQLAECIRAWRPTHVIHAWAMCDLDLCEEFPEMAAKVNVEGTRCLLAALREAPELRKVLFISTDHVFDGERGRYTEEDLPCPKHVFGRTRHAAEDLVRASGLPYMIIRPGLVIGRSFQGNKGPRDFLLRRVRGGKTTHYFTDEWRSPIAAGELAARVHALALSDEEGIFHLAGEHAVSRYDLARMLASEEGLPTENIRPRLRAEDRWAHIRPRDLSLASVRKFGSGAAGGLPIQTLS